MPKGQYQRDPRKATFEANRDPVFDELDREIREQDAQERRQSFRHSMFARRRRHSSGQGRGASRPIPCYGCGARDSRDEHHQGGCPMLPRVHDHQVAQMMRAYAAAHAPRPQGENL